MESLIPDCLAVWAKDQLGNICETVFQTINSYILLKRQRDWLPDVRALWKQKLDRREEARPGVV